MAFTNQTPNYGLPQWIGTDKPTYLIDQNGAYLKIDTEIKNANVVAQNANTTAGTAKNTADSALTASSANAQAIVTTNNALAQTNTNIQTLDNAIEQFETITVTAVSGLNLLFPRVMMNRKTNMLSINIAFQATSVTFTSNQKVFDCILPITADIPCYMVAIFGTNETKTINMLMRPDGIYTITEISGVQGGYINYTTFVNID